MWLFVFNLEINNKPKCQPDWTISLVFLGHNIASLLYFSAIVIWLFVFNPNLNNKPKDQLG